MDNSPDIRRAIKAYLNDQGLTAEQLGARLGVSSSTSIRWCNGKTKKITPKHWIKLRPLLAPYVTPSLESRETIADTIKEMASRYFSADAVAARTEAVTRVALRSVRVYGFANGAPAEGEVMGDVIPDNELDLDTTATDNPRVVAAFRVVGQSMEPDGIVDGTLVLCERVSDPDQLPDSTIVVCKVDDVLYCKHWHRVGRRYFLTSSNPAGRNIELKRQPDWILRALTLQRDIHG